MSSSADGRARSFAIGGRRVGFDAPPFLIAEMSGNHNGSLDRALAIVDAAAASGAHALKIQTFTADSMTLDLNEREFRVDDPSSLWKGKSLYELYMKAATPYAWHEIIFARCRERGVVPFSTPFDEAAVDFLETLGAPCYKIASFENVDLALIRRAARTHKPLFISTGMASLEELAEAVAAARGEGCRDLVLMKCCSSYPAPYEDMNLATIPALGARFGCLAGLSDHSSGIGAAVAATALGAVAIEKHFTLSRGDEGVDAAFSMEPDEMKALARETLAAWKSVGRETFGPTEKERASLQFRRSLYVVEDATAGAPLTRGNVRAIRPGLGLAPKHLDELLGRKFSKNVKKGTPLGWDLVV